MISAIVLAAGRSLRMGTQNKLLLPFGDRTIVEQVVRTVAQAPVGELVVVTGHENARMSEALRTYPVQLVYNPDYASGMGSSLRRGVETAQSDASGYMICLGDMPLIEPATLTRLCEEFARRDEEATILPVYRGRRGHPVIFPRRFRDELLSLEGDTGARWILEKHPEAVLEVAVDDPGILRDVDTPRTYNELLL